MTELGCVCASFLLTSYKITIHNTYYEYVSKKIARDQTLRPYSDRGAAGLNKKLRFHPSTEALMVPPPSQNLFLTGCVGGPGYFVPFFHVKEQFTNVSE